jgi:mannosyl-3-phosphoglycerate phosphatase
MVFPASRDFTWRWHPRMDLVISDLDGTLLDHENYSFKEALPALNLLKSKDIPLVYCTSKTRAETQHWRSLTGNRHPFIVENGGAIVIPSDYFEFAIPESQVRAQHVLLPLGAPYGELVETLRQASTASGCRVRGFHEMSVAEVGLACGMDSAQARLAKQREFDEPFVIIDNERTEELLAAIRRTGKRWTRGGRFFHILGGNDKAAAVVRLAELYRRVDAHVRTIGLGDGLNDAAFLNVVDVPILIRTGWLDQLQAAVPRGQPTMRSGPAAWNEAILQLFAAETS